MTGSCLKDLVFSASLTSNQAILPSHDILPSSRESCCNTSNSWNIKHGWLNRWTWELGFASYAWRSDDSVWDSDEVSAIVTSDQVPLTRHSFDSPVKTSKLSWWVRFSHLLQMFGSSIILLTIHCMICFLAFKQCMQGAGCGNPMGIIPLVKLSGEHQSKKRNAFLIAWVSWKIQETKQVFQTTRKYGKVQF